MKALAYYFLVNFACSP